MAYSLDINSLMSDTGAYGRSFKLITGLNVPFF